MGTGRRITAAEALCDACDHGRAYIAREGQGYCLWLCDEVRRLAERVHRERDRRPPCPPDCPELVRCTPNRQETRHYLDTVQTWLATLYANDQAEPRTQVEAWLVSWGNRQYSTADSNTPVCVTDTEDYVLTAFVGRPAMSHADMARVSGVEHAHRVLQELARKYPEFAPAIRPPRGRGRGGYRVLVRERINGR